MTREASSMQKSVDALNDAIRENPIAAGLIGAGVCWMMFSKVKPPVLGAVTDALRGVASSVGQAATAGGQSIASATDRVGTQVAETTGQLKTALGERLKALAPDEVPSMAVEAGVAVKSGLRSTADAGKRYGLEVQQTLSKNLERQPLLLGAIGLAIGAGIASAFHSTRIEGEFMGAQGAAAREKLQDFAEETRELVETRAQEVVNALKDESQSQGFTPEVAKGAVRDVADKVKNVARAAVTAAKT